MIDLQHKMDPRVRLEFIPGCDAFLGHEKSVQNESGGTTTERRALVCLGNTGIDSVADVEIFCAELECIKSSSEQWTINYTQSEKRIPWLYHDEPKWVGIVKQVVADYPVTQESMREFQIEVPRKVLLDPPRGNEFLITLLVTGRICMPYGRNSALGKETANSISTEPDVVGDFL